MTPLRPWRAVSGRSLECEASATCLLIVHIETHPRSTLPTRPHRQSASAWACPSHLHGQELGGFKGVTLTRHDNKQPNMGIPMQRSQVRSTGSLLCIFTHECHHAGDHASREVGRVDLGRGVATNFRLGTDFDWGGQVQMN